MAKLRFSIGARPRGEIGKHYYASDGHHWYSIKHWPSYNEWTLDVTALADDGEQFDATTMQCFTRETEQKIFTLANDLHQFAENTRKPIAIPD